MNDGTESRPMPLDGLPARESSAPVTRAELDAVAANVQRHLATADLRLGSLESQLKLNTSMTAQTNAVLKDVEFGLKVIGFLGKAVLWAGRLATAIAGVYGLWYLIVHGPSQTPKP